MTSDNNSNTAPETDDEPQLSRSELRRQRDIMRCVSEAKLSTELADQLIRSGMPIKDCVYQIVREVRERTEAESPAHAGHPARMPATPANQRDLSGVLAAKMGISGKGVNRSWAQIPMHSLLREVLANDPDCRGLDLAAMPVTKLVHRAFSTSDFTKALEATTSRALLEAYEEAQNGVLALATSRDLPDFRAMELLRVSAYGEIKEKLEGGEYKTSKFAEELAAALKAAEYGAIQPLTRKALANDSLDIFGRLMIEMGRAAALKERSELAQRLLTGFTWGSGNSTTTTGVNAAAFIAGLEAAALKLRRQVDVDGNPISFQPRLVLVAPEEEAAARKAVGEYQPDNANDVMAFSTVTVEVDHYLPGGSYYVCDTNYPQLVIGRIGGGPVITESEDFQTGNRLYRCQLDMGTAVMDQRSIVKVEMQPVVPG